MLRFSRYEYGKPKKLARSNAIGALWSVAKALNAPIDINIKQLADVPYTISFIMRKRTQLDNFSELPKDKRPPDDLIWNGTSDALDDWFDKVLYKNQPKQAEFVVSDSEIEG